MGMSTWVVGVRPADDRFKAMAEIWRLCEAQGIGVPEEVGGFFEWEPPPADGVEVRLEEGEALKKWTDGMVEHYDVVIAKLPPDVTIVRFVNSW